MSYTIDANVLLYASDRASPFHEAASAFLEARSRDPDVLCLTWRTASAPSTRTIGTSLKFRFLKVIDPLA